MALTAVAFFQLALSGCAPMSVHSGIDESDVATDEAWTRANEFERTASHMLTQNRWPEALKNLRIVHTMRPDDAAISAQIATLRQKIKTQADVELDRADQLQRRGRQRAAAQHYLEVLRLDAQNGHALEALRAIEKNTVDRRQARNASNALARAKTENDALRAMEPVIVESATAIPATVPVTDAPSPAIRNCNRESHTIKAFVSAGDLDSALQHYEQARRCFDEAPGNTVSEDVRDDLAQAFFDQGFRVFESDIDGAIVSWESALFVKPDHALAKAKLRNAVKIREFMNGLDK